MNKNIRISVKTPVGMTQSEDTHMGVGQGTSDGAIISANSLDSGVSEYFDADVTLDEKDDEEVEKEKNEEENVEQYKDMLHPIIFQDDLAKISESREEAQIANDGKASRIKTAFLQSQ